MTDIIDELLAMDDAALSEKMGLTQKLLAFKEDLAEAAKLSGDNRSEVAETVTKAFMPSAYAIDDLGYTIDRINRKKADKDGTSPSEITDCCCGD